MVGATPMTEERRLPSIQDLRCVVRAGLRLYDLTSEHPEYDDLESEAVLGAWRALNGAAARGAYSWTTIATNAGVWAAREYLQSRRSGRMAMADLQSAWYQRRLKAPPSAEREAAQAPPLSLDSLPVEVYENAWDGGFPAADARLQLWLLAPDLTLAQREALRLVYLRGCSESEAARQLGITHTSLVERLNAALRKYRRAAGLEWAKSGAP